MRYNKINDYIHKAVETSKFDPTIFLIYDKSIPGVCDRLILVKPFEWYIWCVKGELYVLNPEGGINCGIGYTPAIKIHKNVFVESCLRIDYDTILQSYMNIPPYKVPYDITGKKFTIFTAINILLENYITFNDIEDEDKNNPHKLYEIDTKNDDPQLNRNKYNEIDTKIHLYTRDDNVESSSIKQNKIKHYSNLIQSIGKRLYPDQVEKILSFQKKSNHELANIYATHIKK